MPEVYSDEIFRAIQALMVSGAAAFAYKTAKEATLIRGKWGAGWRSVAWCFGIALFAAVTMGSPSCEESGDPLRGGCEEYADDGYDPSLDARLARFLFVSLILTVPALFGVANVPDFEIRREQEKRKKWATAYDNSQAE